MKIARPFFLFALLLALLMLSGKASAQCYQPTMSAAQQAERAGNMERAAALYREAQGCWDGSSQQKASAQAGETRCRKAVEQKQQAEQRKREEAERKAEAQRRLSKPRQQQVSVSHYSSGDNEVYKVGDASFTMVWVADGTFTMGCTSEQGSDCFSDEKPTHSVTLSGYYIGETEVTQALWKAVMGSNPSVRKGDYLPVERVSWDDAQSFIRKLNILTGRTFRLPTEAEWEYAARGGSKSLGYKYAGGDDIGAVAWYVGNSGRETHPVGQKRANELGLYDMSGNVWEWCSDRKGDYSSDSQTNPRGPSSGSSRVYRGGSWFKGAGNCRISYRDICSPDGRGGDLGLRLVLVP